MFGTQRFGGALGVGANDIFDHDDVAGFAHRIIRFGRDEQCKGLQVSGDVHFAAAVVAYQYFAEIDGAAFRRDCPKNVGQVLVAESCGLFQIAKFHLDFDVAFFALYFGLAIGTRHQVRSGKVQLCGAAAMLVVDGLHAATNNAYSERGCRGHRLDDFGRF